MTVKEIVEKYLKENGLKDGLTNFYQKIKCKIFGHSLSYPWWIGPQYCYRCRKVLTWH